MFKDARHLLEKMPSRDVHDSIVRWTCLVTKYSRGGWVDEARVLFDIMPERNVVTYNAMLSGYVQSGRLGTLDNCGGKWSALVDCLTLKTKRSAEVQGLYTLFRKMPERNVVSWTAMIGGFAWNGFYREALLLFLEWNGNYETRPNGETFISLVYACARIWLPHLGKQLHAQLIVNN
ncbi:hypothetical protein RchiOBHm_Chr4g0411551 [Rosa chinensis]|uniref:Pentatricopeptide n=1 Tax=Rosa chinensis TaxID=74649 RepID=A0A2P6QVM6_ROSCH|nr:hypothetical protein RchiOBHm_Chr4g0411551 [Rosa chinensis]